MKAKGVHITDKGLSVKTSKRFDREDYVDATQRCVYMPRIVATLDEHPQGLRESHERFIVPEGWSSKRFGLGRTPLSSCTEVFALLCLEHHICRRREEEEGLIQAGGEREFSLGGLPKDLEENCTYAGCCIYGPALHHVWTHLYRYLELLLLHGSWRKKIARNRVTELHSEQQVKARNCFRHRQRCR